MDIEGLPHHIQAEKACKGGCRWIQLRVKNKTDKQWEEIAILTREVCKKYHATLIINDNVAIAKKVKAHGVHLGKNDTSPLHAKELLGNGFIIGGSANTTEDIVGLSKAGVDYIGLGPYRYTTTKQNLNPVIGKTGYELITQQVKERNINIPVIAIGGISFEDLPVLAKAGLTGVAVSSKIAHATDIINATRKFIDGIKRSFT